MLKLIDKIPLSILLVLAVFFTLAPFQPEPHLLEKSRMLLNGTLHKPIDIFDLLMHATPLMLLIVRLLRLKQAR
ncbi:MAG: RND transporter [Gammaproteobacteria bacterium]